MPPPAKEQQERKSKLMCLPHLSNLALNCQEHLCVQHSYHCITGGSGLLSRALSHISPRWHLSSCQLQYGGSGKRFWSLHPLSPLLWGWQWRWRLLRELGHPPPPTSMPGVFCEVASWKSWLRLHVIHCCHLFGQVHCSLIEDNYTQNHFWNMLLDQYQEFVLLLKTLKAPVYRRTFDFTKVSTLYCISSLASEMRNTRENVSKPKTGQLFEIALLINLSRK